MSTDLAIIGKNGSKFVFEGLRTNPQTIKSMEGIGGAQFEQSKQHALAAVKEFCPPELREQLSDPVVGNNPAVFAMLAKIGQRISQDSFVTGKPAPTGEKRAADILYNQS